MSYPDLKKALKVLANETIDKVLEYKKSNALEAVPCELVRVMDIDYVSETYTPDWDNIVYSDHYVWRTDQLRHFIDKEIKTLPSFTGALDQIQQAFNGDALWTRDIGLERFIRVFIDKAPNQSFNKDQVGSTAELLIQDYVSMFNKTGFDWQVDLWLSNIKMESDALTITDTIAIRRVQPSDLEHLSQRQNYVDEFATMTGRVLPASVILSLNIKASGRSTLGFYPEEINKHIETWLFLLRFFRPGDIYPVFQSITPRSLVEYPYSENKASPADKSWKGKIEADNTSVYQYPLRRNEEGLFHRFIEAFYPMFNEISHTAYLTGDPYELAIHRYNDALVKSEVNTYKILSSISSVEALLSEGTEITYKISMRVAKLMSFLGFDAIEVSTKMKQAYSLRSKIVHADKAVGKILDFAKQHTHEILNYNRLCILLSMLIRKEVGREHGCDDKNTLIRLIDHAMIDPEANNRVGILVKSHSDRFVINPYVRNA